MKGLKEKYRDREREREKPVSTSVGWKCEKHFPINNVNDELRFDFKASNTYEWHELYLNEK